MIGFGRGYKTVVAASAPSWSPLTSKTYLDGADEKKSKEGQRPPHTPEWIEDSFSPRFETSKEDGDDQIGPSDQVGLDLEHAESGAYDEDEAEDANEIYDGNEIYD